MSGTPLQQVPGISQDQVRRLASAWITTAEQVLAVGSTQSGIESLAEQANATRGEIVALLVAIRSMLPAEEREELETPPDTSDWGLGAREPAQEDDA